MLAIDGKFHYQIIIIIIIINIQVLYSAIPRTDDHFA